jgi:putative membrane protein
LIVLTLGLLLSVINAGLLAITAGLSSHLDIAVFSRPAETLLPLRSRRSRHGTEWRSADAS